MTTNVNAYNSHGKVRVTLNFDPVIPGVCLDFDSRVKWIAMSPEDANALALNLLALATALKADEIVKKCRKIATKNS